MPEFASRGDFLASCQRRYGTFDLPVSGLTVRYRSLSESEFAQFEMDAYRRGDEGLETDEDKLASTRERLIILCLCDGEGNRLLNDGDLDAVGQLDAGDTGALYDVLKEHCGIARRVREAKQRQEALKKTSNRTLANGSHTGLQPTAG